MSKKEQLFNARDVAYMLNESPDDVLELAREGKIRGIRRGRFWKFRLSDVEAYKRKHELSRG